MISAARIKVNNKVGSFLDVMSRDGREIEWLTASIKIAMAFQLWRPMETLNLKAYAHLRDMGFGDGFFGGILFGFGLLHIIALGVNGFFWRTPLWRGICCCAGMVIFGVLSYLTWTGPMVTPGLLTVVFGVLVPFELLGCRRAGADYKCLIQLR